MLRENDLHPKQMPIMDIMLDSRACSQSDIAREQGVSCATVGMSVRRLERAGLIERNVDENDQRANRLELTELGKSCALHGRQVRDDITHKMLAGFSDDELSQYLCFTKRILTNLEQVTDEWEAR
ncbi:MAG: MarR family transcriptional regulator [Oscillospiraceae bacterium]